MIQALAGFFTRVMQRWLPDAFLFAVLLTFVVLVAGMLTQGKTPHQMVAYWGGGLWNLLTFSMQVLMTLVTGHVLAQTPAIKKLLRATAGLARTPPQAIMLVTAVALVCCWINWGFGLIAGAQSLGVPLNEAAMAVAFGDAWTNMVQPFWALPLLGIAGLGIKDIMGYCTVALLWSGLVMAVGILLLY